jgi:hypothetical protein
MINPALAELLSTCRYDSAAGSRYDIMAGGLFWDDEIPAATDRAANLRATVFLRSVSAYRASLSLDEPRAELESDWLELQMAVPTWPGFERVRIYGEAARLLKVHKYNEAKLLDQALSSLDAPGASAGAKE